MSLVRKNQPERGYFLQAGRGWCNCVDRQGVRHHAVASSIAGLSSAPASSRCQPGLARPTGLHGNSRVPGVPGGGGFLRSEYNGKTEFSDDKARLLSTAGWAEVDESFRILVPKNENWKWRIFTRQIPKGKVDLKEADLKLEAMTLFLFGQKREAKEGDPKLVKLPRLVSDPLTFMGHTGPVWSVAYSPDGKRIVSGSGDKTVKVWDADKGRRPYPQGPHRATSVPWRSAPMANASSAAARTRR